MHCLEGYETKTFKKVQKLGQETKYSEIREKKQNAPVSSPRWHLQPPTSCSSPPAWPSWERRPWPPADRKMSSARREGGEEGDRGGWRFIAYHTHQFHSSTRLGQHVRKKKTGTKTRRPFGRRFCFDPRPRSLHADATQTSCHVYLVYAIHTAACVDEFRRNIQSTADCLFVCLFV